MSVDTKIVNYSQFSVGTMIDRCEIQRCAHTAESQDLQKELVRGCFMCTSKCGRSTTIAMRPELGGSGDRARHL